jgi:hypothetical protein
MESVGVGAGDAAFGASDGFASCFALGDASF